MKYVSQSLFTDQSLWKWMKISRYRRKALVSKWSNLIGRISAPVWMSGETSHRAWMLPRFFFRNSIYLSFFYSDKQWFVKIDWIWLSLSFSLSDLWTYVPQTLPNCRLSVCWRTKSGILRSSGHTSRNTPSVNDDQYIVNCQIMSYHETRLEGRWLFPSFDRFTVVIWGYSFAFLTFNDAACVDRCMANRRQFTNDYGIAIKRLLPDSISKCERLIPSADIVIRLPTPGIPPVR